MRQEKLARLALERLEINTGYIPETEVSLPLYFAEIELLGIKCFDFTEEAAVELIRTEAEQILTSRPASAKRILKGTLRTPVGEATEAGTYETT